LTELEPTSNPATLFFLPSSIIFLLLFGFHANLVWYVKFSKID